MDARLKKAGVLVSMRSTRSNPTYPRAEVWVGITLSFRLRYEAFKSAYSRLSHSRFSDCELGARVFRTTSKMIWELNVTFSCGSAETDQILFRSQSSRI